MPVTLISSAQREMLNIKPSLQRVKFPGNEVSWSMQYLETLLQEDLNIII